MKKVDIIIIGAGMSGLSAARELSKTNKEILVLEARDRIGGRLSTENFSDGLVFERGGELIHGTMNDVYPLARELGIELQRMEKEGQGSGIVEKVAMSIVRLMLRLNLYPKPNVNENFQEYIDRFAFKPKSLQEFIDKESRDFESFDKISALHVVHRFKRQLLEGEIYGENDFMIKGGYVKILSHLAEGLPMQFNQIVEEINWDEDEVIIKTNKGMFKASKVIVATPINVLKKLTFTPELPEKKVYAMNGHVGGDIIKLLIPVPLNAIKTTEEEGVLEHAELAAMWWRRNLQPQDEAERQVFVGWITGKYARRFMKMPEKAAIEQSLEEMSSLFDPGLVDQSEIIAQNWSEDEFALAPYYYIKPGYGLEIIDDLAQPLDNKVFFASEAIAKESGAAHGAFESGLRAAKEVTD